MEAGEKRKGWEGRKQGRGEDDCLGGREGGGGGSEGGWNNCSLR